jgi:hypothetical protein
MVGPLMGEMAAAELALAAAHWAASALIAFALGIVWRLVSYWRASAETLSARPAGAWPAG